MCVAHWPGFPESVSHEKIRGGSLRPTVPPFFFPGVPSSCIPAQASVKRTRPLVDVEKRQIDHFNLMDKIPNFDALKSSKKLSTFSNVFVKHCDNKIILLIFYFQQYPR